MNGKEDAKKYHRKATFDVYIGSVPKIINEEKLKSVFSKYGEISDVFARHSNNPLGYAIIKFKNKQDVDRLLKEVDAVHVDGHKMEVKLGVKNNQSSENGDGTHGKTVSFSEPVSYIPSTQIRNLCMMDANLQVKDSKFMSSAHSEMNGQQIQTVEIICTNVDNSVTFHGCSVYRYKVLQNISHELYSTCTKLKRLTRKPLMKKVYGALYEDLCWYRCVVHRVVIPEEPGKCIVEYIDYGNIAEVFYTNMVDLPEPFNQYCPLAMKCVFVNLTFNPNYLSNVSYLHHLINKRMSLSATLCAYSDWGVPEYQVYKCSSGGVDVIEELVRNGHAMYRTQQPSKSSTPLYNPDNPGCSKFLISHKPKKASTNKTHPKKVTTKELCNGVEKTESKSVGNESMNDAVKSPKICSPDISEHSEDFVPKRIIKRGDISDVVAPVPVLEGSKTVNHLLKVDCVLANLKLVNNIRNLVSFPTDGSIIDKAVADLSLSEVTDTVSQDQKILLESSHKKYIEAFNNIKECTDQKLLSDLKEKKVQRKNELLNVLKQFLESFDCSLLTKRKKIQKLITDLESNSTAWMNVHISSLPDTIEELVTKYNKENELRWSIIRKARENTNEKHKKFMEFLGDFMQEFSLNMLDGTSNGSCHLENSGGKRGSYALKFEESLADLGIALDKEMNTCSTKDQSSVPVSKCILEKLDIPKEKIDSECELYMKYKSLYDDLNNASDISSLLKELFDVQKNIQALTLNCSDDKKKFQRGLAKLHHDLLLEDMLLGRLAKESAVHVPELILEHPKLNLSEYKNNWCLLKNNWHKSYFPVIQNCSRLEPSYISQFAEEPIVIKEFNIRSESERNALIKKAIVWNEIKSKSLVKIKALFNKDEIGICAMFPEVSETLCKIPLPVPAMSRAACNVLQHVLKGLYDIHERGMAHGAVHPSAVLYEDGKVLLDFNSDRKFDDDNFCIKGINFKDPSGDDIYKASDMFGFGSLVLLVLFSNLTFTSVDGVPKMDAFQSIIKNVLSDNDFMDLINLLNPNHNLRPTSKDLYKKGFLKDVQIITK